MSLPGPVPASRSGGRATFVLITTVWLAALLVGLGELFLRLRWVAPSERSTSAFATHPLYRNGPAPGAKGLQVTSEYACSFENNLLGFRGPLPDIDPDVGGPRLLVLGDSQTFGLGVSNGETFCDALRRDLPGVEVLNAGSNGYGTRESLAILHHLGPAWHPQVAVLVFFWNDLEDNVKHPLPEFGLDDDGHVQRIDPFPADFDPLALRPPTSSRPQPASGMRLGKFLKEGLRGLRYRYFGIKRRTIRTPEQSEAAWRVASALLRWTKARADEIGCRLVVAALPDHNQVDPAAVIRNIEPINIDVQARLFAECAALDIASVDLLPPLREAFARGGSPLYYYADRHLTPRGHAVVGQALVTALRPLVEER